MADEGEIFDFGFSFTDDINKEAELNQAKNKEVIESLERRLNDLHSAIIPFLDNLCLNPEKSAIFWPNRVERIEEFKKRLEQIVKGET